MASENKEYLDASLKALDASRKETRPYRISLFGREFIVLPNVFSPKYYDDDKFFGANLPGLVGPKEMLEIGSGTGILSVLCALNGACVTAVDINKQAAENTKQNAKLHGVKIDVRESDLFSSIEADEKFELIFWNHPFGWISREPRDILEKAVIDRGYSELERFFKSAKKHLAENGKILLGTSSLAALLEIKGLAEKYGFSFKLLVKSEKEFFESDILIDLRIYELAPL